MNKIVGYILGAIGIVGVAAYSIPQIKAAIPFLSVVDDFTLLIVSLAFAVVGMAFVLKYSRKKKVRDVPIFQGKEIVGYRRH